MHLPAASQFRGSGSTTKCPLIPPGETLPEQDAAFVSASCVCVCVLLLNEHTDNCTCASSSSVPLAWTGGSGAALGGTRTGQRRRFSCYAVSTWTESATLASSSHHWESPVPAGTGGQASRQALDSCGHTSLSSSSLILGCFHMKAAEPLFESSSNPSVS